MSEERRTEFPGGWFAYLCATQIWRSIFRHGYGPGAGVRARTILSNFFYHLHPVRVKTHGLHPRYTWCMGGITFFLFLVEVVTGALLMFYYRPVPEHAYSDMQALAFTVPLGIVREIHRWGAHAMIITVWLHMLRVFLTGAYKSPREFNWCVGVVLLVSTMFLSFTGYLLPWDQLSIWAVTVGTNMARAMPFFGSEGPGASLLQIGDTPLVHAGSDFRFFLLGEPAVGAKALLNFYVLHCVAVPIFAAVLMAVHFWRVRKDGGISGPL